MESFRGEEHVVGGGVDVMAAKIQHLDSQVRLRLPQVLETMYVT